MQVFSKRPRPGPAEASTEHLLAEAEQVPSKRLRPEPRQPACVPPPLHHQRASEQVDSLQGRTAPPDPRQDAKSLLASAGLPLRPLSDTQQYIANIDNIQPSSAHADAQRPAAKPPEGAPLAAQYSLAASATASLLTAGRAAASTLLGVQQVVPPAGLPASGETAEPRRQQQPADVPTPSAAAGLLSKPGRASPSGITQVDVVPESPEVGSEEGSPFALANVTAAALTASAKPALGDAHRAAISAVQTREDISTIANGCGVQPSAAAAGFSPAMLVATGTADAAVNAPAAPLTDSTTPQAKRAHTRPAPAASRLSRGSGVFQSAAVDAAAGTGMAAAALPPAAVDRDGPPLQAAGQLQGAAASGAGRDAVAPAAQTPPALPDAPGLLAASDLTKSTNGQHRLSTDNGREQADASLSLRLSEPDELSTPRLIGAAGQQAALSGVAHAAAGAQRAAMYVLHTQPPSAPLCTATAPTGKEFTPEPAAKPRYRPKAQPPSSCRRTGSSADGQPSSSDLQLAQRELPPPMSTGASRLPLQPASSTSPAKSDR